jgi:putative iron-dependent peroxidase
MIENMFVGRPPGNYDRLLDFSRAVTGGLFFAPSAEFLETVGEDQSPDAAAESSAVDNSVSSGQAMPGSLRIGSLKGEVTDE